MLYLAHFEYEAKLPDDRDSFGHFTHLVEADDEREATRVMKSTMRRIKDGADTFSGIRELHLHDLVEIGTVPDEGIIGRMQAYAVKRPISIHTPMPFEIPDCRVLMRKAERDGNSVPFLVFEPINGS